MNQKLKIAATVILYNPGPNVINNIGSYTNWVEIIYAIDNSEKENRVLTKEIADIPRVKYIRAGMNSGIAKAINIAAQTALQENYDLLLTMDQDSKARPKMIANMLAILNYVDITEIGIISPWHITDPDKTPASERLYDEVQTVMTSGNLLNLNAYKESGPFNEQLFIDCVDHDYCLRLIRQGYKVIRSNNAELEHTLGKQTFHKLFGKTKVTNNHPPLRRYYITRNRLYLMAKYKADFPEYYKASKQELIKEFKYIILFEKNKLSKIKMMFKGFLDYKKGKMGKYDDQP